MKKNIGMTSVIWALILIFALYVMPVNAFAADSNSIQGTILDSNGYPLATNGAISRVSDNNWLGGFDSNEAGKMTLYLLDPQLPDGKYYLSVYPKENSQDGF